MTVMNRENTMKNALSSLVRNNWLPLVLLVGVCFLLYGQTLGFSYVWDDEIIFLNKNSLMVDPLSWSLLTTPILENTSYMRPFVMLTWWLEFHLFGQNPALSHAVNVAVLCVNVLLVQALAWHMLQVQKRPYDQWWAALAALSYAVHPMLIESTAWVSGRFDMLCTTGVLGASWVMVNPKVFGIWRMLGVVIFTLVALMSKELGVVTPIILLCVWMARYGSMEQKLTVNVRRALRVEYSTWGALIVLLILYFLLRSYSMEALYHREWGWAYIKTILLTMAPLEALWFYISMSFFPFGRVGTFHLPAEAGSLAGYMGNWLALLLTLLVLWQALRRQQQWAWLLLAAYAGIALVLHFVPMTIANNIAQDRFITLPLGFFCVALVCFPWRRLVADRLNLRQSAHTSIMAIFLGGWIALLAVSSISLIPMWKNELVLWSWEHLRNPDVEGVRQHYLKATIQYDRLDLTEREVKRILEKNGSLSVVEQFFYAYVLMLKGDPEALPYLEGVIAAFPRDSRGEVVSGKYLSDTIVSSYAAYARSKMIFEGDLATAMQFIDEADRLTPVNQKAYIVYTRAAILYAMGHFEDAESIIAKEERVFHSQQMNATEAMRLDLLHYCKNELEKKSVMPDSCQRLRARSFFQKN